MAQYKILAICEKIESHLQILEIQSLLQKNPWCYEQNTSMFKNIWIIHVDLSIYIPFESQNAMLKIS